MSTSAFKTSKRQAVQCCRDNPGQLSIPKNFSRQYDLGAGAGRGCCPRVCVFQWGKESRRLLASVCETDRQSRAERQTDRQTHRQPDRQTDRQTARARERERASLGSPSPVVGKEVTAGVGHVAIGSNDQVALQLLHSLLCTATHLLLSYRTNRQLLASLRNRLVFSSAPMDFARTRLREHGCTRKLLRALSFLEKVLALSPAQCTSPGCAHSLASWAG